MKMSPKSVVFGSLAILAAVVVVMVIVPYIWIRFKTKIPCLRFLLGSEREFLFTAPGWEKYF